MFEHRNFHITWSTMIFEIFHEISYSNDKESSILFVKDVAVVYFFTLSIPNIFLVIVEFFVSFSKKNIYRDILLSVSPNLFGIFAWFKYILIILEVRSSNMTIKHEIIKISRIFKTG